jgi:RNA:NAD 2'-phosphotransferase (TPT1/KptA family)
MWLRRGSEVGSGVRRNGGQSAAHRQGYAGEMHGDGRTFYLSSNGVWLTDAVPPGYLSRS